MKTITEKYYRPFAVDQGRGRRVVQWSAWREGRPNVRGYGMTKAEAIHDLREHVQPDFNGTLDTETPEDDGNGGRE